MKRAADGDWTEMARHDTNPTKRSITHLHDVWRRIEHGGFNDASMFEALTKYAGDNPDLTVKFKVTGKSYAIVLVTPFMRRVHEEMQEAGEVVFVDGTASVDRLNTVVLPFMCGTPAGAAPLGVVFTSSQDEVSLTTGTYELTMVPFLIVKGRLPPLCDTVFFGILESY